MTAIAAADDVVRLRLGDGQEVELHALALRVSGARRTQVFLHGVLPSVAPTFVGLVIYRMDSNVRAALILSAFGAGGIGFLLFNSIELFQWPQVGTELIVMFVMVLLVERVSIIARGRISS